jgi:hypothetical protein
LVGDSRKDEGNCIIVSLRLKAVLDEIHEREREEERERKVHGMRRESF